MSILHFSLILLRYLYLEFNRHCTVVKTNLCIQTYRISRMRNITANSASCNRSTTFSDRAIWNATLYNPLFTVGAIFQTYNYIRDTNYIRDFWQWIIGIWMPTHTGHDSATRRDFSFSEANKSVYNRKLW